MFCPACATEYRAGFARCNDCDVDLVETVVSPHSDNTVKLLIRELRKLAWTDSTIAFFLLTFALTWGCSKLALSSFASSWPPPLHTALMLIGTFGPSIAALTVTARQDGLAGVSNLLRRLLYWRVAPQWYLLAIFSTTAILLATGIAAFVIGRPIFPVLPSSGLIFVTQLIIVALSSTSEEIGWRGYALPRLAARFGLRRASLILGLIWATWHLPLFFSTSTNPYRQSFPMYALTVTAISVVFAWLYDKTNGSLLLAALLHTSMNMTLLFLPQPESAAAVFARPTEPVSWIFTVLSWIAAGYLLQRMRRFDSENLR